MNKMDRLGANFYRTVDMIVSNLGAVPLVIQLPIGSEDTFEGVVDLVKMKAVVWDGEQLGASFSYVDIPEDLQEKAAEYRAAMIETIIDQVRCTQVPTTGCELHPEYCWECLTGG